MIMWIIGSVIFKIETVFIANFYWILKNDYNENNNYCELNYHDQKIWRTLAYDIWKHFTAVSTLLGLISSVYHNLQHWRSNLQTQSQNSTTEPSVHITHKWCQINLTWPINLNVSCKLHPYSLQKTWSPPGPCIPKRIGNTHPCNYYNLKVMNRIRKENYPSISLLLRLW